MDLAIQSKASSESEKFSGQTTIPGQESAKPLFRINLYEGSFASENYLEQKRKTTLNRATYTRDIIFSSLRKDSVPKGIISAVLESVALLRWFD